MTKSGKDIFVFVVCGAKEHLDTLHFSLKRLKKHSSKKILVLTDSARNELPIIHEHIIDIKTPVNFDNHQASIYLKTGIHQFLPPGNSYCYLDTDIIALNADVDLIFKQFQSPITFANDHCKLKKFSAYAVNCSCQKDWKTKRDRFEAVSAKYDNNKSISDPVLKESRLRLEREFALVKASLIKKAWTATRYFLSWGKFHLNEEFYFDKKKRYWVDKTNSEIVLFEVDIKKIEKETGFRYDKWRQQWLDQNGNNIWLDECQHLAKEIKATFNIEVEENNWQHWNGGVFLFDDTSHSFLEAWHQKTMHIFNVESWKTRDQGTLIATAWEFGLSNHPTLGKEWNFIADYYKAGLAFKESGEFTDDFWKMTYTPSFLHVYHHWGDDTWDLWRWIENKQE